FHLRGHGDSGLTERGGRRERSSTSREGRSSRARDSGDDECGMRGGGLEQAVPGGDLSRAQETILEAAAQAWVILASLDDWIARQPSLVTKKRQVLAVVMQRMQIAEGLFRNLDRLGLERRAKPVPDLTAYLAAKTAKPRDNPTADASS